RGQPFVTCLHLSQDEDDGGRWAGVLLAADRTERIVERQPELARLIIEMATDLDDARLLLDQPADVVGAMNVAAEVVIGRSEGGDREGEVNQRQPRGAVESRRRPRGEHDDGREQAAGQRNGEETVEEDAGGKCESDR